MKAIVLEQAGSPERLIYREYPDPQAGAGEVVIRLKAAALNHRDIWQRLRSTSTQVILGSDGAGVIAALGTGVEGWCEGDEVMINPSLGWLDGDEAPPANGWRILGDPDNGTYAEQIKVPAANLVRKPAHLSWAEAAALPLAGLTAWRALTTRGRLNAGQSVLILGIGGGVATILLQMAKRLGATAYVTSSSDEKLECGRELGADAGFNYRTSDWVAGVLAQTGGRGVDLVIDSSGQQTWPGAIKVARAGGRVVSFGATTGPEAQVNVREVFAKQLNLLGTMMGNAQEFSAMVDFYAIEGLRPVIHQQFPLAEATAAHRLMEAGEQFGKLVLTIG